MENKPKILIVDDERLYINLLTELLQGEHQIFVAKNGAQAIARISKSLPDLILMDIKMPELDGYETCRRLKGDPETEDIPIIFLTASADVDAEMKAFENGAVDYITKPMNPAAVKARVQTHLALRKASLELEAQNQILEQRVSERTREIALTQEVAIHCMASLAEARDNETGAHIRRTQYYIKTLAEELRKHPRFCHFLNDQNIELLFKSAPLHDIGKVGVPDSILKKPGALTGAKFDEMKKHTVYGRDALLRSEKELGSTSFLRYAREIAYSHQEKWDGSGYPEGLKGEAIPVSARLMAVGDVYDALVSERIYKPKFPHEEAVAYIGEQRAKHFDPDIVDAFVAVNNEFKRIADTFNE